MRRPSDFTGFADPAGPGKEEDWAHGPRPRNGGTEHRVEHFGSKGRGLVRLQSLKAMQEMLEQSLAEG